jgi:aminoglycoside phosphotransferase (APT) family kinase protein
MDSLTKRKVTHAELEALAEKAFPGVGVARSEELTDGWFNAVYEVELADGRQTVLKVAPAPGTPTLTYEHDMMRGELEFFARAGEAGVALPELHFQDTSGELIESDWFFMAKLEGDTIADLTKTLGEGEVCEIRRGLGKQVAHLHSVVGESFGYLDPQSRTRQPTWRGAFLTMLDDILGDAQAHGVTFPRSSAEIAALASAHGDALDRVREPRLVHFDMWDNNVFVREQDGLRVIEGIIDGERAFFGDPLAEFVGVALAGDPDGVPTLVAGYEEVAGRALERDEAARRRLALYKIYLALIMFTEVPTRGFAESTHQQYLDWATGFLHTELELLDQSRLTTPNPRARARHHERIAQ